MTVLLDACRRVLQALEANDLTLTYEQPGQGHSRADLAIWDVDGVPHALEHLRHSDAQQNILLASRELIEQLRDVLPNNVAAIVLKPLAEGPLRACLQQVLRRARSPNRDSNILLQLTLEAIVRLQQYDHDRTNFLARAMHDFRAPLTALRGYCGLLFDEQLGPVSSYQSEILSRMKRSLDRLSRMAEDMFQLSVGNRCDFKLKLEQADLSVCIDQAVHEMRPFIQDKDIHLTVTVEALPTSIYIDRAQVEQVLINLFDNAFKFTPRHGSVQIRAYPYFWERRQLSIRKTFLGERRKNTIHLPNTYRIDISDSGPIIPTNQLSRIFEEYTSYGGDQDRSGAGLGLAICKLIISRHNGRVWAESSGAGNTFSFVLPIVPTELQNQHAGATAA